MNDPDSNGRRRWARAATVLLLALASSLAHAVPSFARQTGQPCAMCHVGGFGPQLTDYGIQFKLTGYTTTKGGDWIPPVAGMVMAGLTHTSKAQDASTLDGHSLTGSLKGNDNLTLDQVSLFVSGRISDNVGIFSQITYDGIAQHTSIDNVDLRAAATTQLGDHLAVLGVSVNNNPGVQDPFNTLPAWLFPYISSNVAPAPSAGTILDEAFGQKATGVVGYAQLDGMWYGELGTYRMQTPTLQKDFGIAAGDRDPGALRSPLYARLAARKSLESSSMEAGVVLFKTGYQPDRSVPDTAHIRDLGFDASYRWTSPGGDIVTVLGNVIKETQAGADLTEYSVNASYFWDRSWGATLQRFGVNAPGLGSRGTRLQFDWTPFGKTPPSGGIDANMRFGLQLTAYDKLDGVTGSAATDANSLYLFAWLAF
ncbi:MAG TPA: hypothetical protein VIN75_05950 [Burkholderiaceae bacterium]